LIWSRGYSDPTDLVIKSFAQFRPLSTLNEEEEEEEEGVDGRNNPPSIDHVEEEEDHEIGQLGEVPSNNMVEGRDQMNITPSLRKDFRQLKLNKRPPPL